MDNMETQTLIVAALVCLSGIINYFLSKNFATKKDLKDGFDELKKEIKSLDAQKVDKETFDVYKLYVEEKCKK